MARVIGSFERVKLLSPQRKEYGDKVVSTRGDLTFENVAEKLGVDSLPNAIKTLDNIATSKGIGTIVSAATREDQKEADTRFKQEQDELLKKETAEARSAVEKQKELIEKLKTKPKDQRVSVVRKLQKDFDAARDPERKAAIRNDQRAILQSLIDQDEIDPAVLNKFPEIALQSPQKASPPSSTAAARKSAPTPSSAAGEGIFGPLGLSLRGGQDPIGRMRLDPDAIDRARRTLGLKLTDLARQGNKEGLDTAIRRVPAALRLPILQDTMDKLVKGTGTEKAKKIVADAANKIIQVQLTEQPRPTPPPDYTIRPKSDKEEDVEIAVLDVAVDYRNLTGEPGAEVTPENLRKNRQVKQGVIDFIRTLPEDKQFGFIEEMRRKLEALDGGSSSIFRDIKIQFARERDLKAQEALPEQVIKPGGPAEAATPQPPPPPVAPTPGEFEGLAAASAKDPLGFYERMKALDRQAEMMDAEEQLKVKQATLQAQEQAFRASAPQLQQYLTGKIGIRELNSRGKVPLTSAQLMALARSATTPAAQAKVLGLMSNVVDRPSTTLYGMATGQDEFNYAMKVAKLFPRIKPIKPPKTKSKEELDAQKALAEQRRASAGLSKEREKDIRETRPAKKEKIRAEAERARTSARKMEEDRKGAREGRTTTIKWKATKGPRKGKILDWNKYQVKLYKDLAMAEKVPRGRSGRVAAERRRGIKSALDARKKQVEKIGQEGDAAFAAQEASLKKKRDGAEAKLRALGGVPKKPTGTKTETADGLMRTPDQQKDYQKALDKYNQGKRAEAERDKAEKDLAVVRAKRAKLRNEVGKATDKIIDAKEKFVRTGKGGKTPEETKEFIEKKRKEAEENK